MVLNQDLLIFALLEYLHASLLIYEDAHSSGIQTCVIHEFYGYLHTAQICLHILRRLENVIDQFAIFRQWKQFVLPDFLFNLFIHHESLATNHYFKHSTGAIYLHILGLLVTYTYSVLVITTYLPYSTGFCHQGAKIERNPSIYQLHSRHAVNDNDHSCLCSQLNCQSIKCLVW